MIDAGIDYRITFHGDSKEHLQEFGSLFCIAEYSGTKVHDLTKIVTNGRHTKVVKWCLTNSLEEGHEYFGVLDDDAVIKIPENFQKGFLLCRGEGSVALGTYSDYLHRQKWSRLNNDTHQRTPDHIPYFVGSQIYRRDFIVLTQPYWEVFLEEMGWTVDVQFGFLAVWNKLPRWYFNCKGYYHSCSSGNDGSHSLESLTRHFLMIKIDRNGYRNFLKSVGEDFSLEFTPKVEAIIENTYLNALKRSKYKNKAYFTGMTFQEAADFLEI